MTDQTACIELSKAFILQTSNLIKVMQTDYKCGRNVIITACQLMDVYQARFVTSHMIGYPQKKNRTMTWAHDQNRINNLMEILGSSIRMPHLYHVIMRKHKRVIPGMMNAV